MKTSKEQAASNRERILEVAGQLFRERGYDGIGVADLMRSAGLTHGGFYGHFNSKDDLIAQSSARALQRSLEKWQGLVSKAPENPLAAIVRSYLSARHRDQPGLGCTLTALGGDMARQSPALRQTASRGVHALVDELAPLMAGDSAAEQASAAWVTFSTMIGALILSRVVEEPDLSDAILRDAQQALLDTAP